MIKKYLHILLLLLFTANIAGAQPRVEHRFERIHAIKVAYITDKVQLSADVSARFWPVYNMFDDEKRELRRNFYKKYRKSGDMNCSDQVAMRYIDDDLDYQEQELALRRKYKVKLLKIITPQQLSELYKAEREFKVLLLQQLKEKKTRRDNEE